jgi:chemotaxis protein CheC
LKEPALDPSELSRLEAALHRGSAHASEQLGKWLGRSSIIELDALRVSPIAEATELLTAGDDPICFCSMQMKGEIGGQMILAFDDSSGLELADLALAQPAGTTTDWSDLAMSAVLETTNIVCCAYLNELAEQLRQPSQSVSLVPSPPEFHRDYAQSLMQFALMDQALEFDLAILAKTSFTIEEKPVRWNLLFIPDGGSLRRIAQWIGKRNNDAAGEANPQEHA